jgi:ketosteroid isomerase-like protein
VTDEDLIRAARAASNAAILRQDLDTICSFWTAEVHVLGSISLQLSGVEANRRFYDEQFAKRPDTIYTRTASTVHAMAAWKVGLESGDWVATWTDPDGPVMISGRYMAQWLRSEAGWRIQGELYVPTACEGGKYCERHPVKL